MEEFDGLLFAPSDVAYELAKRLKSIRKRKKITQQQLALRCNLTLHTTEVVGFLLPATTSWLTSPFPVGRSARYGYAITHRRAEHLVPYAVCLISLSPAYSVELQMFMAPSRSLCMWNPHLQV